MAGNRLDGEATLFPLPPNQSGNGVPGGDFLVEFSADSVAPIPLELFNRDRPLGSMVGTIDTFVLRSRAAIHSPTDIDTFEMFVEAGEMFSLFVFPFTGTPTLLITVSAAGLQSTSGVPFLTVLASALPNEDGMVRIDVQADSPTDYLVFMQRNVLIEFPEDEVTLTSSIDVSRIDLPNNTSRWAALSDMASRATPLANLTLDLTGKADQKLEIGRAHV